jgi:NADPH:quinone reductase-like Zn-dependent oxidoreductase
MKAIVIDKHGGPEALVLREIETPTPAAGEVLVKVEACGLNHLDIWTRAGTAFPTKLPHVLGCDVVGTVAELGKPVTPASEPGSSPGCRIESGMTDVKIGDFVMVAPGWGCGTCDACHAGSDSLCTHYQMMGRDRWGGYAEYCTAPARNLIPISRKYSAAEWAATPLVFLTAWHMLVTRAQLKKGETVLILAAGSGIGTAAIQIAKYLGATVIATASTDEKLKKAKELGADFGVNYTTHPEFHKEVKKLTSGRGVDVVFEHVGPSTFRSSAASLAPGGRLVFCGATTGAEVAMNLRFMFVRQLSFLGSFMGSLSELKQVVPLLEDGIFHPVLDSAFPLQDAAEAQQKLEDRNVFGKVVLTI